MKKKRPYAVGPVLRVYWQHAKRYPFSISFALLFSVSAFIFSVIVPLWYKKIVDLAVASPTPTKAVLDGMIVLLWMTLGFILLRMLCRRLGSFLNVYFQPKLMNDLGKTAFSHLLGHSYRFFSNNFTGTLVRRVTRLQSAFEQFADRILYDIIPITVSLIGATIVLFFRHVLLGWLFLSWVVLFIALQFAIQGWKMRFNRAVSEKDSEATGVLSDSVSNDITIKTFAQEAYERSLFNKVSDQLSRLRFTSWGLNEAVNLVQSTMMITIEFVLFYTLIHLWSQGNATIGDFILVQAYIIMALDRLWDFGQTLRKLNESFSDASEMVEILQQPHEVEDRPNAAALVVHNGAIEFTDVGFKFHEERSVLDSFDLSIAGHEKIALVGPSGAGKTTITKLILRFFDVSTGEITIDGQNIANVTQHSLRSAIAFVPQEPVLFHRSLMENIRYGKLGATDEEVKEAARHANAPQGYETFVGERGIKLSGGERQRIAIARAILKNAPILVLDEATSSLDSESEALIQDALAKLMEGKTVIAIAHRLSTVMRMDRIIVIEGGKVVTSGTHDELVRHEGGLYKKLWEIQAGGFITDDTH